MHFEPKNSEYPLLAGGGGGACHRFECKAAGCNIPPRRPLLLLLQVRGKGRLLVPWVECCGLQSVVAVASCARCCSRASLPT